MPTDVVIRVRDVRKAYGDVRAVDGVSFEVARGEVFGLLGPNGAGKTTTVEMLEGLREPDGGQLEILGIDAVAQPDALKERIGVTLQTAELYPKLTVVEVLDLFRSFYARTLPTDQLIDFLDLGERRKAQTRELSGGQRQRLAVALALVNDPEVVFLDEPTTGLDPAARRSLWDLVERLREQGKTILLTTHYMEEADHLCNRLAIMDHGKILEMGTASELIDRRFHERAVRFDRTPGLEDAELAGLPAVASVKHDEETTWLYTRDVPTTIGALLALTEARGVEPGEPRGAQGHPRGRVPRPDRPGAAGLRQPRMRALRALTIANIRSYLRDRQALFWTLAFPLIFVVLFGAIFSGGDTSITVAWVDQDASPASAQLRAAFASAPNVKLVDSALDPALQAMQDSDNSGVIVVPRGYAAALAAAQTDPTKPATITYYVDPSQQSSTGRDDLLRHRHAGGGQPRRPAGRDRRASPGRSRPSGSTPSRTWSRASSGWP